MEEYLGILTRFYGDNGKENGNYYIVYWGYRGIMEKNMETTIGFGVLGNELSK